MRLSRDLDVSIACRALRAGAMPVARAKAPAGPATATGVTTKAIKTT